MTIRCVLLDIEGTTTDIGFVHDVLFPYAEKHLPEFVNANIGKPEVRIALGDTKATVVAEGGKTLNDAGAINQLLEWIKADRKHTALKSLQGMIWARGYAEGDYQSHIYPDVPKAFERWKAEGLRLAIYSSGSVQAQKLLFGHTPYGDLNPCFEAYFDTTIGGKKDSASYTAIAEHLKLNPDELLFLSDHPQELAAAQQAGCHVTQLLRDGQPAGDYPAETTFDAIRPTAFSAPGALR